MRKKGAEKMANVLNGSRTDAMEVFFSSNFAVVFDFNIFPVLPSKAKSIGKVLTNRQNAAIRFFSLLYRELPIDAPNHPA